MNSLDSATFYHYFTKLGFKGDGMFYKHLQKSVSRTIGTFSGQEISLMFTQFDATDSESGELLTRLNKGVRSRLTEHALFLIRERKIRGNEAYTVYQNVQNLKPDYPRNIKDTQHELFTQVRAYLEKIRYFV